MRFALYSGTGHLLNRSCGVARRILWLAISVGLICNIGPAKANGGKIRSITSEPILRVEAVSHTSLIRRVAVDPAHGRLITTSDDKTVRFWRQSDGRLERTLRVPIGYEHEGQLFGLAVSPDGGLVAVGGWTCWDWEQSACVYVFDVEAGELVRRIGGMPDAISALAWSPDGRYLAIGLQGRGGLRILRTDTFAEVARDTEFHDKIMELDYDRHGWLAVASVDGFARLYRPDHRIHARTRVEGADKPSSVRFAPDSHVLAIGFVDAPVVTLLNSRDLKVRGIQRAGIESKQKSFSSVAWSVDGEFLFAAGEQGAAEHNAIWRWSQKGHGIGDTIVIDARQVSELQSIPNGAVVFVSEDPRIGIVRADGSVLLDRGSDLVNFSDSAAELRVSTDASLVEFGSVSRLKVRFRVDAQDGVTRDTTSTFAPVRRSSGWTLGRWRGTATPTINNRTPQLDDYEIVRSYALAHDDSALLLGTEWAIRLLDREARERWRVKLPAIAWAVNIAGNGKLAVAALSDGTIRWYRMSDGAEQLAYFPHANGEDWIAWVPSGYYMSSPLGDQFVGWHVNRGKETSPDYYRAVQFERVLYRPDLVMAALTGATRANTRGGAGTAAGGFDISRLLEIAPPRLKIAVSPSSTSPSSTTPARPHHARIRVSAERTALPMRDLTVFVNDIPVTPSAERELAADEANKFVREIEIPLFGVDNEIRVESFTGMSMGVAEGYVQAPWAKSASATPSGDLFVLAIGNNQFPNLSAQTQLEYASRDAEEFAATLTRHAPGAFRRTHVQVLSDSRERHADRASIMQAVRFLRFARAEDTVVVFLASHGISDKAGNYYFVPRDATLADMEAISREPARDRYDSLVPWTVFFEALRNAAGRRVLIVDTCQARGIEGRFEAYSLMKRSASSRFSLIVAAKADEESQEYEPARHGLFTYALLQALGPQSDTNGDGHISVRELFDAARPIVERLHDRATGPQTPQIILPRSLEHVALGSIRQEGSARADSR